MAVTLIVTSPPSPTVAEPTVRSLTLAARAMPRNASAAKEARMVAAAAGFRLERGETAGWADDVDASMQL